MKTPTKREGKKKERKEIDDDGPLPPTVALTMGRPLR
jgi:hypothetical protein